MRISGFGTRVVGRCQPGDREGEPGGLKLKKGKKKLRGFIVGSIKLPKKKGNYVFTLRAFKKIGKLKYYGRMITKTFR